MCVSNQPISRWGVTDVQKVRTSDRGDELFQSSQQLSIPFKVVEVMLNPVTTHIQHPVITMTSLLDLHINSTHETERSLMFSDKNYERTTWHCGSSAALIKKNWRVVHGRQILTSAIDAQEDALSSQRTAPTSSTTCYLKSDDIMSKLLLCLLLSMTALIPWQGPYAS